MCLGGGCLRGWFLGWKSTIIAVAFLFYFTCKLNLKMSKSFSMYSLNTVGVLLSSNEKERNIT